METQRPTVMVRTYLDQAVIRYFDGMEDGLVRICNEREGVPQGIWLAPKTVVCSYDPSLYEAMLVYDPILDEEPAELRELWRRGVTYLAEGDDEAAA